MSVPLTKASKYLFKPNPNVGIKYKEHDISGEKRVTEFLTPHKLQELDPEAKEHHRTFIGEIDEAVQQQMKQTSFQRYVAIALLILTILLPSLLLFFLGGSHWGLIGGVYYAFFAYLLVEAYITANRNYFEYQMYEKFEDEHLR
ncbi:hypothetical protein [Salinicoccus roseus]|uniref:hypothetical protein n=1 Tax=Salinicoccus roseus TaxID=45670 RepID=UPI002301BC4A|nr:hypothetical protein [Salinicoccus roseus]